MSSFYCGVPDDISDDEDEPPFNVDSDDDEFISVLNSSKSDNDNDAQELFLLLFQKTLFYHFLVTFLIRKFYIHIQVNVHASVHVEDSSQTKKGERSFLVSKKNHQLSLV